MTSPEKPNGSEVPPPKPKGQEALPTPEGKPTQALERDVEATLPYKKTTDLLKLEQENPGTLGSLFCEKKEGNEWRKLRLDEQFQEGDEIRVDFTGNGSRLANRTIGAGDILPPTVKYIIVRGPEGGERIGIRLTQGVGIKANRTGYYDLEGKYIPIYDGYTIVIPPQQEPPPNDPLIRSYQEYHSFRSSLRQLMQQQDHHQPFWFTDAVQRDYQDRWDDDNVLWNEEDDTDLLRGLRQKEKEVRDQRIQQLTQFEQYEDQLEHGNMHLVEKQHEVFQAIGNLASVVLDDLAVSSAQIDLPPPRGGSVSLAEVMQKAKANPEFIAHLQAIAYHESSFRQDAVSYCGAMGLFQFIPATWQSCVTKYDPILHLTAEEKNPFNIEGQIKLATVEMARLYYAYDNLDLVSVAWNAGEHNSALVEYLEGNQKDYATFARYSDGLSRVDQYLEHVGDIRRRIVRGELEQQLDVGIEGKVSVLERMRIFGHSAQEVQQHLVPVNLFGHPVMVHELIRDRLERVNTEIGGNWQPQDMQCFCWRNIRGYEGLGPRYLSNHSFGIALDIDPASNPMGRAETTIPLPVIAAFERNGFTWGGRWQGRPDPMHFELSDEVIREMLST